MATLATLFDLLKGRTEEQAEAQARQMAKERKADFRLRAFPNDDVHLMVKKIDNSRVVRADDPDAPKVCWKTIGGAGAAAVVLIGTLLPTGYNLIAGYQLQELKKQREQLETQRAVLEVEEAQLLSPEHLAGLAKGKFVYPTPGQTVHIQGEQGKVAQVMGRGVAAH